MMKRISTNIQIIVLSNLMISFSFAQCSYVQEPTTTNHCENKSVSDFTTIDAQNFKTIEDGVLRADGGVCINNAGQQIISDSLIYDSNTQIVKIDSQFTFKDKSQLIQAQQAQINLDKNEAQMMDVYYQLSDSKGNGNATKFTTDNSQSLLKNLTYTTCPKNNRQWNIEAQSAEIDHENQVGTFKQMKLKFKGVPLLYLPYAKLPLNSQRQSGFLIPEIGNSTLNGFDFSLPYYINIAENMDATLTPRYLSERGAMFAAEFRYLGESYSGEFFADYLPTDKITHKDRGFAEFKHRQVFSNNWSLNTRLSNVSDRQYFQDFGYNINATSQAFVYSFMNLNGFGDNWLFKGQFNDYQIISDTISLNNQPYQTLPRLAYSWFNNDYSSWLNYGVDAEWANFYREKSITSYRLDVTPYLEKTFQNNYARLTPKLAYRYTSWDYQGQQYSITDSLESNRALPIASLDYRINFEKQFADGSFSSIEPRLYYLYAPYRNQQNIPLFDTHNLTFGTGLLYQSNSFSGADRQADANQLSIGISQRHFDTAGNETWNVTLGQIAYFRGRKVQLTNRIETRKTSPIITEFNYFYRQWKSTISVHWDTQINQSERALAKIQYKGKNNSLFNFAYRFRQGKIEQLDSSVVIPFGLRNRFIARWNYSMTDHKTIEAIAGIEHKNCCWATRLVGRHFVYNEQGDLNTGIFFELQLDGLGSIGRNPRRLLKQSILGYSEEF